MSPQLLVERLLLLRERQVPIGVAPLIDATHGAGETISGSFQLDHPVSQALLGAIDATDAATLRVEFAAVAIPDARKRFRPCVVLTARQSSVWRSGDPRNQVDLPCRRARPARR